MLHPPDIRNLFRHDGRRHVSHRLLDFRSSIRFVPAFPSPHSNVREVVFREAALTFELSDLDSPGFRRSVPPPDRRHRHRRRGILLAVAAQTTTDRCGNQGNLGNRRAGGIALRQDRHDHVKDALLIVGLVRRRVRRGLRQQCLDLGSTSPEETRRGCDSPNFRSRPITAMKELVVSWWGGGDGRSCGHYDLHDVVAVVVGGGGVIGGGGGGGGGRNRGYRPHRRPPPTQRRSLVFRAASAPVLRGGLRLGRHLLGRRLLGRHLLGRRLRGRHLLGRAFPNNPRRALGMAVASGDGGAAFVAQGFASSSS